MKHSLHIEADFDKPELLKDMVEKLVIRHNEKAGYKTPQKDHEALEISSTEAYVCGSISLDDDGTFIRTAFDSSFLFSCIKGIDGGYEVTWSTSMS